MKYKYIKKKELNNYILYSNYKITTINTVQIFKNSIDTKETATEQNNGQIFTEYA